MALDPTFATPPSLFPTSAEIERWRTNADALLGAVLGNSSEPMRINTNLLHSPEWLREDIAGLEEEIACAERRIAAIQKLLADLPVELLEKRRDVAEFRQAIIHKRAELAAKTGGAQ